MQREEFLLNIKRKLETAVLPEAAPTLPPLPEPEPFNPQALEAAFTAEVETLSGVVHAVESDDEALETILDIFANHEAADFISWNADRLPLPALLTNLSTAGKQRRQALLPAAKEARAALFTELYDVPIGLTGADGAIAESGALALVSKPGSGRLASLLPPVHIAILSVAQIVPTLQHYLAIHSQVTLAGSNLVFICGPSRTADIEMTLTIGVHGPKELHIILIP